MDITIHRDLGEPGHPAPAAHAAADLGRQSEQALLGHTDFHYRADTLAAQARDEDEAQTIILATDDEVPLGFLHLFLPRRDHLRTVHVEARLHPDRAPRPLLDALWPTLLDLCRQEGRTEVTWWEYSRQDDPTLVPATGTGAVESSEVTDWLGEHGFTLDQVEVVSTLHLAAAVGEGDVDKRYGLVTWQGPTPEHLLDGMARLRARMSTDAPHGSREAEEALWDAARIRRQEAVALAAHRTLLWAVALNADGEPVGYTILECPDRQPEIAHQLDTLVRAGDRGHGLGLALKRANLAQLQALRPAVRRVHTWNAGENRWMLGINRDLGFAPTSALGAWQRSLDASSAAARR